MERKPTLRLRITIIDSLISMLLQRITMYSGFGKKVLVFLCFLCFLGEISNNDLPTVAKNLIESYPEELELKLETELVHFNAFKRSTKGRS